MKFLILILAISTSFPGLAQTPAADFITPLLGAHHLQGDAGCENVNISQNDNHGYDVFVGKNKVSIVVWDNKDSSVSATNLAYRHKTSSGVFGCNGGLKEKINIQKSDDGQLSQIQIKRSNFSGCGIAPWDFHTQFNLNCSID
jgi:hypothetical protein